MRCSRRIHGCQTAPDHRSRRLVLVPARRRTTVHSSGVESCRPWHDRRTVGKSGPSRCPAHERGHLGQWLRRHPLLNTTVSTGTRDRAATASARGSRWRASRWTIRRRERPGRASPPRAHALGFRSVAAVPLRLRDQRADHRCSRPLGRQDRRTASRTGQARPGPGRHRHDRPPPAARPTATDPKRCRCPGTAGRGRPGAASPSALCTRRS